MSLKLENVSHIYGKGTSTQTNALNGVSLEINKGEFVAIIGHTGSGKSTLIQHFNGLEKATEGNVYYEGKNISDNDFNALFPGPVTGRPRRPLSISASTAS